MPPEYTPGELIDHENIATTPLPRNPGWEETATQARSDDEPFFILLVLVLVIVLGFSITSTSRSTITKL